MEKINGFQITALHLAGFKSFAAPTTLTFGDPTAITGGNGRGKSSIADAITFAVTGLPFFGERRIDRLHSDNIPQLSVTMEFLDSTGQAHTLCRSRKNSRMAITYDGCDVRQLDLNDLFGERDVFLSIFNPLYFIEELGDEGKSLLERYLPRLAPEEILSQLSEEVRQGLPADWALSPEGHLKQLREEIRSLENNRIYLQGQQDLAAAQLQDGTQQLIALRQKASDLQQERDALVQKQYDGMDVEQMQNRLVELSALLSDTQSTGQTIALADLHHKLGERRAAVYAPKYAQPIAEVNARIQSLATQYQREMALASSLVPGFVCPTCRRTVTEAELPVVQQSFRDAAACIVTEGKAQRAQLEELNALEQQSQQVFQQYQSQDIAALEAQIAAAKEAEQAEAAQQDALRREMQSLTADLELGHLSQEEHQRLTACTEALQQVTAQLTALEQTVRAASQDFTAQLEQEAQEIQRKKEQISHLILYVSKRAELTFSQLTMNRVAISLYDVVKSTGEVKDTFQFTYGGRRYDRLSLSEKIRAGLEVSELLKRLTGRNYPVFLDNMESVESLDNVRPTGQVLLARCVGGADLTVRPVRPIVPPTATAA